MNILESNTNIIKINIKLILIQKNVTF